MGSLQKQCSVCLAFFASVDALERHDVKVHAAKDIQNPPKDIQNPPKDEPQPDTELDVLDLDTITMDDEDENEENSSSRLETNQQSSDLAEDIFGKQEDKEEEVEVVLNEETESTIENDAKDK